jgi:thiamine monophosphate kinase
MMDVSDGLAKDLGALTPGAVPRLDASVLPCRRRRDRPAPP